MCKNSFYKNFSRTLVMLLLVQLVMVLKVVGQCTLTNEEAGLQSIYDYFQGNNWNENNNWNTGTNNLLSWDRIIQVTPNGFVKELDLGENNLGIDNSKPLPANFLLCEIELLWLDQNGLTGRIPNQIFNLTSLTNLYLFRNNFDPTDGNGDPYILEGMENLVNLKTFGFDNNTQGFSEKNFPNLSNLDQVDQFYIRNQEFNDVPNFQITDNLLGVGLAGNRLTFEDLMPFTNANNLGAFFFSPQKEFKVTQNLYPLNEGDDLTINLGVDENVSGNSYDWYKDGNFLTNTSTNTLTINNVATGDAGVYTCQISNATFNTLTSQFAANNDPTTLTVTSEDITVTVEANEVLCQRDRDVLIELYNTLGGAGWTNRTNWLSGLPLDQWYGVTTNANGCVIGLNLENNNLVGTQIPTSIGNLSDIESLVLSNNSIAGTIPTQIGNLTKLVNLYLDRNLLTGNIPAVIGDLTSLQFLHLNQNELNGAIPPSLGSLSALRNFSLWDNQLTGEIPTALSGLTACRYFAVGQNDLSGAAPDFLGDLSDLEELYLNQNTGLTGPLPSSLTNLQNLNIFHYFETNLCTPNYLEFFEWEFFTVGEENVRRSGIKCNPPTDILLSNTEIFDDALPNSSVGFLTTTDLDLPDDTHIYELNQAACDPSFLGTYNHDLFIIEGNELKLSPSFILPNGATELIICITTTDKAGDLYYETFAITVLPRENGCVTRDRAALTAIYNTIGGANWTNKTNWLSDLPLDQWFGITTSAEGCVTQIDLTGNNLSGQFSVEFGDLLDLEELRLGTNNITGPIPASISNLSNLRILHVYENNLGGNLIDHAAVFSLGNLEELFLYLNNIGGTIPASIGTGNLRNNLNFLTLGDNNLTGTIPDEIYDLTNLSRFHLNGNNLTGSISTKVVQLTSLNHLRVSNNNFSGPLPAELGEIGSLKRLWIEGNEFTFGDLIPILGYANLGGLDELWYSPQGSYSTTPILFTGTEGETLEVTVDFKDGPNGNYPNLYSWYKDGNPTAAFTESNVKLHTFDPLQLTDAGFYKVDVTNPDFETALTRFKVDIDNNGTIDNPTLEIKMDNEVEVVVNANNAPTDINLDNTTIDSDALADALVGNLSTVDLDNPDDTHTYTLSTNCGGANDNALFAIVGSELRLASDFVLPVDVTTLTVCIRSTDLAGAFFDKQFTITINILNNAPTDITLDNTTINSDAAASSLVGNLATVDADVNDTHTYTLTDNCVPTVANNNALFAISGNQLLLAPDFVLPVDATTLTVCITSTDAVGASYSKSFEITINILNNPPTDITLDNTTINSDALADDLVGNLNTVDLDNPDDTHTYTLTDNCGGANNNALFAIVGSELRLAPDFVMPVGVATLTVCITSTDLAGATTFKSFDINILENDCVARDRAALTAIYNALGGTAWINSTNWLAVGIPLSEWHGVTTNNLGCVTELNLAGNNLVGETPPEIGNLLELEFLDFGGNNISGNIPNEVSQLSNLRTFGMAANTLTGTLPDNFNNLSVLERIWIDDNNLSGNFPAVLLSMPSLTEIYMQINQYDGTLPDGFSSLTNLIALNIGDNGFSGFLPATIGNLGSLATLGLYNNNFTGTVPDSYANLTNLDIFVIQGNELEGLIPNGIAGNNDFENIQIEENKFTFQDVLPFIARPFNQFIYSPQDSIGTGGVFAVNQGETLPVDLGIDANITDNVYQWFKDGEIFGDPTNLNTIELSEAGNYTCRVTNPRAIDLELWSRVITLRVDSNAPTAILLSNNIINEIDAQPNFTIGILSTLDDDTPNDFHTYTFTDDCGVTNRNNLFAISGDSLLLSPTFTFTEGDTLLTICVTSTDQAGLSINDSFDIIIKPTIDDCVANDRVVLEAIYDAFNGDAWNNKTNWKSELPLGQWFGVETNEDGCVTRIILENNGLVGTIPAEVGNLSEIIEINFGENAISGTIPADFGRLLTLELLWLDQNLLTGTIPAGFFGMSNLTNLYLFRNNLTPPMPDQLNQLTKLLVFGFDNNETPFTDTDFPTIGNLTVLQKFYIQNHDFEDVPTIANPNLLTEMGLAGNRFTFEDILPFSGLGLDVFAYSPQDSVGVQSAITLQKGETFTIDLGIDVNITNSVYRWYKDGALVAQTNSNTFSIAQVTKDDEGEYTCEVTNPNAADLTLFVRKTVLTVIDTDLPPPTLTAELDPTNPAERVILTWTYPAEFTPDNYTIERSVGDSLNFVQITNNWTDKTFTDGDGLVPGGTYFYRILATVEGENSPYSNIAFVTTNSLPTISDIDKTGAANTLLPFTLADFTDAFEDVDNDPIVTVQILSLPANGQLTLLGGTEININDELEANQLSNLVFNPDTDFAGSTSFDYNASDGFNYAFNAAKVNITIEQVEDVDLVINNPQTSATQINAGSELNISAILAIEGGPTSNQAVFVLLLSTDTLPDQNDVLLASSTVPAQSTGTTQEINNAVTIPEDITPGDYFIVYYIDAQQEVIETDELNNLRYIRITILPAVEDPGIVIMNLITANSDGSNDKLYIRNIENYPDNKVILLDRWGNIVFERDGYSNDFEPIVGQDVLDFGAYVCIVKVNEPQITVKRMVSIIKGANQ